MLAVRDVVAMLARHLEGDHREKDGNEKQG